MTSVGAALTEGTAALANAGVENPRGEARLLLGCILSISPAQVFARAEDDVGGDNLAAYYASISERCQGKPLAHITGRREFWSLDLRVSPATLIPRPDTETVVELACDLFRDRPPPETILDLGTGSGCILLALLTVFGDAKGVGADISPDACGVAADNARSLGFGGRTEFIEQSWTAGIKGTFDLVVSNPPYIPSGDIPGLDTGVRDHEPVGALDGGPDGLDAYRSLLPVAASALAAGGVLVLEVGVGQADAVSEIATMNDMAKGPRRADLAGIERAVSFYKKGIGITGGTG